MVGILLEDTVVAIMVGFCQIASGDMLAKAQVVGLMLMCLYRNYQVSQTLTIAQLTKHQG